jgi:hypothetical protein
MEEFRKELEEVINKHSMENGSDTPDFILAEYLVDCLKTFDKTMTSREKWYSNQDIINMPEELKKFYKNVDNVVDKIVAKSDGKIKRSRMTFEEAEKIANDMNYHRVCARATLYPGKTIDEVPKVTAEDFMSTKLTVDNVIAWMNTWEQLRGTAIPIRFKEDFSNNIKPQKHLKMNKNCK